MKNSILSWDFAGFCVVCMRQSRGRSLFSAAVIQQAVGEAARVQLDLLGELTPSVTSDSALIWSCLQAGGELRVYFKTSRIKKVDLFSL